MEAIVAVARKEATAAGTAAGLTVRPEVLTPPCPAKPLDTAVVIGE